MPDEPPNYVAGFLFSEDRLHVALIEKNTANKPGQQWQHGLLNGIGGKIEEGETPSDAIAREFSEEAGIQIASWEQFCVLVWRGRKIYFFRAFGNLDGVKTMTDETVRRVSVGLISGYRIVPNLAWLVPMALDKGISAEVNDLS
jgi:8-oxo-dGTP diphosphatase